MRHFELPLRCAGRRRQPATLGAPLLDLGAGDGERRLQRGPLRGQMVDAPLQLRPRLALARRLVALRLEACAEALYTKLRLVEVLLPTGERGGEAIARLVHLLAQR